MTARDYIKKKLEQLNIDYNDELIDAELKQFGIDGDDEATDVPERKFDLFVYNVIPTVFLRAQSVSEGQYSVSYSVEALKAYYAYLSDKLGLPNKLTDGTIIRDISKRW